jgi:hypothetical protein
MKKITLLLAAVALLSGGAFAEGKKCCKKKGEKCAKEACCKKGEKKECGKDDKASKESKPTTTQDAPKS